MTLANTRSSLVRLAHPFFTSSEMRILTEYWLCVILQIFFVYYFVLLYKNVKKKKVQ